MNVYPDIIKSETIMIGDTLETDIQGAIIFGIDSLLITHGITGLQCDINSLSDSLYQPTYLMNILQ